MPSLPAQRCPLMPEMSRLENVLHCPHVAVCLIESSHNPSSSGYVYDSVPLGRAVMECDRQVASARELDLFIKTFIAHLELRLLDPLGWASLIALTLGMRQGSLCRIPSLGFLPIFTIYILTPVTLVHRDSS